MLILIAIGAFAATMLGGLAALRIRDRLHLVLGFSAGAVVAVAFFDLLPESLNLAAARLPIMPPETVMLIVACGFLAFMLIDRMIALHSHSVDEVAEHGHDHDHDSHSHAICNNASHQRGFLGAGALSLHSFLDGLAVGFAFHVSAAVGLIVAAGVLTHDFSDGINTASIILKSGGEKKDAFRWLLADAIAPMLGVLVASIVVIPDTALAPVLAFFAGTFLYIGASDLLPESHHAHPTRWTTFATILGVAVLYGAIRLAGI